MKHALIAAMILCFAAGAAFAAKAPSKKLSQKDKASLVVDAFLRLMDAGKDEEAFAHMDFDALLIDNKQDPARMTPKLKASRVKAYKNLSRNMFDTEKKKIKYRNFSIGAFKQTGGAATLELINTPPKGTAGKTYIKTFKMLQTNGAWKIYGILQQAEK